MPIYEYKCLKCDEKFEVLLGWRTSCYPSLSGIPVKVDVVNFVVPPTVTEEILKE